MASDKLSRQQVDFVLRRAAEIDTSNGQAEHAGETTLTVQEVMRLGEEAGLPRDAVVQALT